MLMQIYQTLNKSTTALPTDPFVQMLEMLI